MPDWRSVLQLARARAARVPMMAWAAGGVVVAALGVVLSMELSGGPYVALYDGLTPAQGGKVIAQLQKLGIPYELQNAGELILVPAPDLAAARLRLGATDLPQDDVSAKWSKLEDAPMTTTDAAQSAMATQALEASLAQSIEGMSGIQSAQVYLALPRETPFLGDQPKPAASVVITADATSAQSQGQAIASLVAGAVPGLHADQVNVETTSGVVVYPLQGLGQSQAQFHTVAAVENKAASRIAELLTPMLGAGNFRTDVSADVDFTQERVKQITFGPAQAVAHSVSSQNDRTGSQDAAIGIPGALSNEPPPATAAATPPIVTGSANASASGGASASAAGKSAAAAGVPAGPHDTSKSLDQTFQNDQSERDITKPDWTVKGIAVSVVLNRAALGSATTEQVKAAIAAAFDYPQVRVNVLAAAFNAAPAPSRMAGLAQSAAPVTRAMLELMAAAALLFGFALPLGRRLTVLGERVPTPAPAPLLMPQVAP
ncbi:MAG: flagellar M-ring protein FliF, partial [Acidocella sp. 20-61-6]